MESTRVFLLCLLLPVLGWAHPLNLTDDAKYMMDYTGFKVVQMQPSSMEDVAYLKELEGKFNLDMWSPFTASLLPVRGLVSPKMAVPLFQALDQLNLNYTVLNHNYQSELSWIGRHMVMDRDLGGETFNYETQYHTYAEIVQQLRFMANKYSTNARYFPLGTSSEGREIPAIEIGSASNPTIIFECGVHSREWPSPAFALWLANALLTKPELEPLLAKYRFSIVPSLNVDGYVYTHTRDRMWRKTRSRTSGGGGWGQQCIGVDANRNFDIAFNGPQGASNNPCSEQYHGPRPFSEPESRAIQSLVQQNMGRIAAYFSVHTYSELWMYPYGYTRRLPRNEAQLRQISQNAVRAIASVNGRYYRPGPIAQVIYVATGSSVDWAYEKANIGVSFALELGTQFIPQPYSLRGILLETWAGVKAAIESL